MRVAAKFMAGLGYKKFAVLTDTTDYANRWTSTSSSSRKRNGSTIVGSFGVPPDQQDLSAELTQIKALDPQVVFFGGLTPLGARAKTQMANSA